ncbi:MAG TPA: gluconeogenesis factor YvcK family protein [Planctomycetota bacterium]|nr:gluconeogenesis factor YvcK family protein [Planctomycetota bacterium]
MTRIVTLGGGTGQGQLLRGLSRRGLDVTGIVGVTDNGGHSGHLRREYGLPAVGDVRNCLTALGDRRNVLRQVLDIRFGTGELEGASLGNLILAALTTVEGSLTKAVSKLAALSGVRGTILPVSEDSGQIAARLSTGKTIRGEWEIIRRKPRSRIIRVFHKPPIVATPQALHALKRADLVVLGPGSLRTALVSILLATGVRAALRGKRVAYVLNILTQAGQTDGFTARDHVDEIARYLGRPPDRVIANTKRPPAWAIGDADWVDPSGLETRGGDLLEKVRRRDAHRRARPARFVAGPHLVRHDPAKLARAVMEVLQ